ncbi:DUF1349 domain-containing protein [Brevibacillus laterosporus]|uniref:DUF1349 domain-containing protein n=1 Tax=Brevibacillus laterosporus TaxID=1465 RepID=A0AAP3DHP1_BRELA|nr:DUF1349 domain-containing protein [Brevibacillus laterosporus]AYB38852.1 DUF1349 domain-containing protein [Brevibacillus laterosporus]MBM7107908.1 hypothetical protein [Brevibacillus laterosporus]MCR8981519.1 DUF1349 domain-containing protein [Brevibacillus laterosporus]MCZ0808674.1 DUF1349 domain-containing protein [Brevibacillus laterosporus]MCZ0827136.1 DUF1349 domain-containing protein [Brevibacillus laterosporus]
MNPFDQWINEANVTTKDNLVQITAPSKSDFFINPATGERNLNAPFFFTDIQGDFVLRSKVSHQFLATYDAAVLMVMESETIWAKLCLEFTDFNTYSIVSVVTNGVSDDANGPIISNKSAWLQMARKGNTFALHYSLDGEKFQMVRYFSLPVSDTVKVGIVSQSPTGEGLTSDFSELYLKRITLHDIRAGQ